MQQGQTSDTQPEWYVQVDGTDYGPFDARTLWEYMSEGRVGPQSFVRRGRSGGFRQVANTPALAGWLRQLQGAATDAAEARMRDCLVMAEIRSGRAMAFLQTLQSLGDVQRVGDTVWMLRSPHAPSVLCDVLAAPLGPQDRMFVVDTSDAARASFNLGRSVDQGLNTVLGETG